MSAPAPPLTVSGLVIAAVALAVGPGRRGGPVLRRLDPGAEGGRGDSGPVRSGWRWAVAAAVASATRLAALVRRGSARPPDAALDRRLAVAGSAGLLVGLVSPVVGVGAGVGLWVALGRRARTAARRRDQQLVDEVPDLAELFRLAVGAGLTVHLAVAAVSARSGGLSGATLARVPVATSRGERLADALDEWAACGEPIRPLAGALAAAERYGDPLGSVLDRVAAEARLVRRRRAEEAARRLPVQLLLPLVLCVLPAFVLLAVVPLLLVAVPELPQ